MIDNAIANFEVMYNLLHTRARQATDKTAIKECWSELHTVSRCAVTETHTRKCDHLRGYLMGKWQMIDPEANEIG